MLDARFWIPVPFAVTVTVSDGWSLRATAGSIIVATCHPGQLSASAATHASAMTIPADTVSGVAPTAFRQRRAGSHALTVALAVIASGSALEVDTHLQLLLEATAISASEAATAVDLFDEVRAMTWRLLLPRSG